MSAFGEPISERQASPNSHTAGIVCAHCNNGWMSRLESSFKELLPRLQTKMDPRLFSKRERRCISVWLIKTGIIAHWSSNYRKILPSSFCRSAYKGTSIPAGTVIFGGNTQGIKTINWHQSNISIIRLPNSEINHIDYKTGTFQFNFSIEDIFLGFAWHKYTNQRYRITTSKVHNFYPRPTFNKETIRHNPYFLASPYISLKRE